MALDRFESVFRKDGNDFVLLNERLDRAGFVKALAEAAGRREDELDRHPAIGFLADWVIGGQTPYELCCTSRSAFLPASPDDEAGRLALAQIFILSFGQSVPAIYFNDLLGLENDMAGFKATGKPRDLNRKKSRSEAVRARLTGDPFAVRYRRLLNRAIGARANDRAFYPGSRCFEFKSIGHTVFLNHGFARGAHAAVVGNILPREQEVELEIGALIDMDRDIGALCDVLTGNRYAVTGGTIRLTLGPYGAVWLNPAQ